MRIVFLLSRFPYPLEKGDKLRAMQHIKMLSQVHELHVIALSDSDVSVQGMELLQQHCKSVNVFKLSKFQIGLNLITSLFRSLPLQVGYFYSKAIERKMQSQINDIRPDIVYCQLIRTALYSREYNGKKVIDFQDAFAVGTLQRLQKSSILLKPLFKRELNLVREFEKKMIKQFDVSLIISEQDRSSFDNNDIGHILILPNAVDSDYFQSSNVIDKKGICFVGNMNYLPNVDAAEFLVNEIMPLVWAKFPDIQLIIAGANPSSSVRALDGGNVTITGWVDDIRTVYACSKIFIAPMRMGTGLQNKILEAMSMRVPCVTTTMSFIPLGARSGREILVGDNPQELAAHILNLLGNHVFADELGENGRKFVDDKFSVRKIGGELLKIFESL